MTKLSHLDEQGNARMVNIAAKAITKRTASAQAVVHTCEVAAVVAGDLPKGDVLVTAKIAGIMAAKRTSELIPMCHPLAIHGVEVDFEPDVAAGTITITATVTTVDRTGVEMEALTAVSVAALTVFDMIKAADEQAVISNMCVIAKSGGKSGEWQRTVGPHE